MFVLHKTVCSMVEGVKFGSSTSLVQKRHIISTAKGVQYIPVTVSTFEGLQHKAILYRKGISSVQRRVCSTYQLQSVRSRVCSTRLPKLLRECLWLLFIGENDFLQSQPHYNSYFILL